MTTSTSPSLDNGIQRRNLNLLNDKTIIETIPTNDKINFHNETDNFALHSNGKVKKPVDLNSLPLEEIKNFVDSFDTIISDCDGVLWKRDPISGVKETLQILKKARKKIHFLSNNCVKTPEAYGKQFERVGVSLKEEGLLHPGLAIIKYLKDVQFTKKIYCIATTMMVDLLTKAGFHCTTSENSSKEDLKWFMEQTVDEEDIGAVIVDFDVNVNYLKLRKALSILKRSDVLYIVGATEKTIPVTPNFKSIGPGPFIDIISDFSGRTPIKLSKPSDHLKQIVMENYKIADPRRVLFVGDTLLHDMEFGHLCNFKTLLVLSGATSLDELTAAKLSKHKPDYFIDSFGNLGSLVEKYI